ncbi:MAG: FAD/NAD(P)-binding oxidoreductase [Rhodospirillales bacterium 24-66-33]|uniref:FAD/NAD(P)-dependent oxidoreductase n=1 Tax=Reyranella sp. TaxID=1929291 RepID=UPI000BC91091|nr:MAG: FAD/NAD(P)-binding oxidoreductase [Rhodospirillales bacterium 35-66-84]OYZ93285.1 MAG: FAD/NAD(P)-binding oxidoreductase [Rhodospirillales bacterium 24-66-33]OZB24600.1 MAG: FAD/NAD(P)-binding oxidoreductase [Rhodospirillales bacterium 39-66-50]
MAAADLASSYELVVIGGGPAGLAAATLAARAGVATVLFDENPGIGGQIYRAITSTPVSDRAILGKDYWDGAVLADEAKASGALIANGATVWSLDRQRLVGVSIGGKARVIEAGRVIIATGSQERPFPIPGWTLPGVMTAGAAQTALKAQGLVVEGRTVLAGSGPLLWLLAAQTLRAGGRIAAILDTTPRRNWLQAMFHLPDFALSPYFAKGLALLREVRAKVPVHRVGTIEAVGTDRVREVVFSGAGGTRRLPVDLLLLHQGVVPNVNLANAAGVAHVWNDRQICFVPVLDADFGSSVPGIAVAGDGAGIAGGTAAAERGRIAAIAAVRALRPDSVVPDTQAIRQRLQREEMGRAFLDWLNRPADSFRLPVGDTIACRCEEVTAQQVRETAQMGCEGPNQMKAFLRCGMGPCQGRLCGLTVTELIAAERKTSPDEVGYYRLRPPVKPITLAELASLPISEVERKAVER